MTTPCICALCNTPLKSRTSYGICPSCYTKDTLREWDRLQTASRYARRAHLPVTLTLIEWLTTVSEWNGLCAWCREVSFSYIEMVHPLDGLIYDNVAPCCRACATHKRGSFDEAKARVAASLAGERPIREEDEHLFMHDAPMEEEVYAHQAL